MTPIRANVVINVVNETDLIDCHIGKERPYTVFFLTTL